MNINELFEKIQNKFLLGELNGEFLLEKNCIIWLYCLDENAEEIECLDENDENFFNFEASSSEELLQEAFQDDLEKLENLFDEIEEIDNWNISDFERTENTISFKIF